MLVLQVTGPPEILDQVNRGMEDPGIGQQFTVTAPANCEECGSTRDERLTVTVKGIIDGKALVSIEPIEAVCDEDSGGMGVVLEANMTLACKNNHSIPTNGKIKALRNDMIWHDKEVSCPECGQPMRIPG